MQKLLFSAAIVAALFVFACGKGEKKASVYTAATTCATDTITYAGTVKDILDNTCALSGCHSAASKSQGVNLSDFANAKDDFTNGLSLCTINHDCIAMPQGGNKLSATTIEQLTCWVKNGCKQ